MIAKPQAQAEWKRRSQEGEALMTACGGSFIRAEVSLNKKSVWQTVAMIEAADQAGMKECFIYGL